MEELHMMLVYQVFIMVLVQGATRSGFHYRTDLFFFTFATKAPISRFSPRHFFSFFFGFLEFLERIQAFLKLGSMSIRKISYDKPRP